MDMFYARLTTKGRMLKLKEDFKKLLFKDGEEVPEKFRVTGGKLSNTGNCILFIIDHVTEYGFMRARRELKLVELCVRYGIKNRMVTYSYLKPCKVVSRNEIIESRELLQLLVSIVRPQLIVLLGEKTTFSFMNRKKLVNENHGKIIGNHNGVPLLLTYEMGYYTERMRSYEIDYRHGIMSNDWEVIMSEYTERIVDI